MSVVKSNSVLCFCVALVTLVSACGGCCRTSGGDVVNWYIGSRNEQDRPLDEAVYFGAVGGIVTEGIGVLPPCTELWTAVQDRLQMNVTFVVRDFDSSRVSPGNLIYQATAVPLRVSADRSKGIAREGYLVEYTVPERWPGECPTVTVQNFLLPGAPSDTRPK